jgi:thiol-disulfide isomerase/thioredoxin
MAKLSMQAGLAAVLLALAPIAPRAATPPSPEAIAWLPAAGDADVDRAFAQARSEGKPLLLYWGAKWCPPCNQLKATLFNRHDFIERTQAFVSVSIDGDSPGAQKLGARFKVRGYPTLILFNPQGQELTRLPGEIDAPQVVSVMQLGLANGRPIQAVLADVNAGKRLSANEWRLLAFYSWDTDEQQLVPESERPALLLRLAQASPADDPETATRLWLRALAENAGTKGFKPDAALRERVRKLLADPAASRAQMDLLTNAAPDIVKALAGTDAAQRSAMAKAFDAALQRLQADATLSRADRVGALLERVELARLLAGAPDKALNVHLPAALLKEARDTAAREDREITDGYERQAVIGTAAHVLARAGLWDDSDALLKANLGKSHSPYYLMSSLARHAQARGDKAGALRWYREAYDRSEGGATRLQWGASYVAALVDLAPQDSAAIEKAAQRVFGEAAKQPNAFYERSAQSLQRVGGKLQAWNAGNRHRDVLQRLQAQLQGVCGKLDAADPQRATCEGLLRPAAHKPAG